MTRKGVERISPLGRTAGGGWPPPVPTPHEDNVDPIGKLAHPHSVKEARQIQREVGSLAILEDRFPRFPPQLVAGADAAYSRDGTRIHGAVAVLRYPELSPVEVQCAERPAEFPYVPGLFAFREGPVLRDAWTQLRTRPDLVIFHGHGTLHPEGCGLATHMGVLLDVPAIGVAGRPIGTEAVIPGPLRGDTAPVHVGERIAGCAVRTRAGAREVYVSPGHRISLETAVGIVLATATRYRMPEPLRAAHRHAVECRAMREKTGKSWKKSS